MVYPIQSLAILAPILFIVLMAGFFVIGFFGGWKRAAFWGGGNFLFYIIGLIAWKLSGDVIASSLAPMIKSLIKSLAESFPELDVAKLTAALIPPIFFLMIALVGNIILVINYYAWYKNVSGIKQDIKIKRAVKFNKWSAKVAGQAEAQTVEIQTVKGEVIKQKTSKQKIINSAVGAVAMTALMLPGVITTTNAVFFATTTSSTRTGWVANMYNAFDKLDKTFSWASYYSGETGDAFNSILSGLQLVTKKTDEPIEIKDPNTGDVIQTIEKGTSVMEIVTNNVPQTVQEVVSKLDTINPTAFANEFIDVYDKQGEAKATEAVEKTLGVMAQPVNKLAATWNGLVKNCEVQLQAVFNSGVVTDLINQYLEKLNPTIQTLVMTEDIMTQIFGERDETTHKRAGGLFKQIIDQYEEVDEEGNSHISFEIPITIGEETKTYKFEFKMTYINALKIKLASIKNIKSIALQYVDLDKLDDYDKAIFNDAVDRIVALILYSEGN